MSSRTILQRHTETVSSKALDKFHAMKRLASENAGKSSEDENAALDGFAEVFAAMAASSPRPIESEPAPKLEDDDYQKPIAKAESESTSEQEGPPAPTPSASKDSSVDRNDSSDPGNDVRLVEQSNERTDKSDVANTRQSADATSVSEINTAEAVAQSENGDSFDSNRVSTKSKEKTTSKKPIGNDSSLPSDSDEAEATLTIGPEAVQANEADLPLVDHSNSSANEAINLATEQDSQDRDQRSNTSAINEPKINKEKSQEVTSASKPNSTLELTKDNSQFPTQTPAPDITPSIPKVAAVVAPTVNLSATASKSSNSAMVSATQAVGRNSGTDPHAQSYGNNNFAEDNYNPKPADKPTPNGREEMISRIKLMQRVGRAFQGLGAEGGTVRIRLAPDELGSVQVEMQVKNRSVDASVIAQTEAAAATLREHLPELRSRLESMNLQVEKLEVRVESEAAGHESGHHRGHDSQNFGQSENHSRRQPSFDPWLARSKPMPALVTASNTGAMFSSANGIDVRV